MTYSTIRNSLQNDDYIRENSFTLLREISLLINSKKNEDLGRELLIRVLDKRNLFQEHLDLIYSLIRSTGLFPYLNPESNELSALDAFTFEMHRPLNIDDGFVFHSMQFKIYQEILNGKNIVLSASTSVGKSLIIDALIASKRYQTMVLVVPTIALIDETRHRIIKRFNKECKIITHPSQVKQKSVFNIYILTQERVIERTDLENVDIFVIDEF